LAATPAVTPTPAAPPLSRLLLAAPTRQLLQPSPRNRLASTAVTTSYIYNGGRPSASLHRQRRLPTWSSGKWSRAGCTAQGNNRVEDISAARASTTLGERRAMG